MARRVAAAAALWVALTGGGLAQTAAQTAASAPQPAPEPPVTLLADEVTYDRETGRLIAAGSVEALYQGRILRASRIVYDEPAGEIRAEGPILLVDPATGVMIADAAALTPDLAEGLIEGARLLIAERLQIAAVEARRRGGRFLSMDRVIASSCTICPGDPHPTWAIRAKRVVEDEAQMRIYFEHARLEVLGLPIAWLPRMSIPDPRARRASGFLAPEFVNSQIYGAGVKTPYYKVLGPSADMTLTPFVTNQGGLLMEGEYRRLVARGGVTFGGVYAFKDGLPSSLGGDHSRWFLNTTGDYALGRGFSADFDVSVVSDDVFLKQFDYSDADLLTSTAAIRRTRAKDNLRLEAIAFQSLLPEEDSSTVPAIVPDFTYRRVLTDPFAGGFLGYDLAILGVTRDTGDNMVRGTAAGDWRRDWTLARGLRVAAAGSLAVDAYRLWQDPGYEDETPVRTTPLAQAELRWPMVRRGARADQVLEPVVQVIWSDSYGDLDLPNEDSELPEFSYANLFSTNRFPGRDRLENGLRANIGLEYARYDPSGWNLGLTFGRVLRASGLDQFPEGTGLDGRWSDYVGSIDIDFDWGLGVANRTLVSDDLDFSRNEFQVRYAGPSGSLAANYVYLAEDNTNYYLGPQGETSEFGLNARYRVHPNVEVRGNWRYDAVRGENLRAGGGVTYGNECVELDLSVSRRYTSSDNLPAATTIGFGLRLAGLGASSGETTWPQRACVAGGLR